MDSMWTPYGLQGYVWLSVTTSSAPLSFAAPQQVPAVLDPVIATRIKASSDQVWDLLHEINAQAVSLNFFYDYTSANLRTVWTLARNKYKAARNQPADALQPVTLLPMHQLHLPSEEDVHQDLRRHGSSIRFNTKDRVKGALVGSRAEPLNNEPFVRCPLGPMDRAYNYIISWEAMALYCRAFNGGDNVSTSSIRC